MPGVDEAEQLLPARATSMTYLAAIIIRVQASYLANLVRRQTAPLPCYLACLRCEEPSSVFSHRHTAMPNPIFRHKQRDASDSATKRPNPLQKQSKRRIKLPDNQTIRTLDEHD
jgi:hypothetical protein